MSKNQAFLIYGAINNDLNGQSVHAIINRHFFIPCGEENNIK